MGGGLVAALAIGTGAFLILDDDGGSTTVIAPAYVPDAADLGRDAAAAARAPEASVAVVTEAERVAELARRSQNFTGQNEMYVTGSGTAVSDADRLSEAERDAAIARRSQNFVE